MLFSTKEDFCCREIYAEKGLKNSRVTLVRKQKLENLVVVRLVFQDLLPLVSYINKNHHDYKSQSTL
jgi:hypothetical protein